MNVTTGYSAEDKHALSFKATNSKDKTRFETSTNHKNNASSLFTLFIAVLLFVSMIFPGLRVPNAVADTVPPQDLVLGIGADSSQLNFSWYCDEAVTGTPTVMISGIATPFTGIQGSAEPGYQFNKVAVSGLEPSTTYECQVSSDGINFSESYTFTTASAGDFTFAVVGDPQIGCSAPVDSDESIAADTIAWQATVAEITAKGASFIAGTGDQIENAGQTDDDILIKQKEYSGFYLGLTQGDQLIPFAATLGNHEGDGGSDSGSGREMFGYHTNLPNASTTIVDGFQLVNYCYLYNNVLFVVLDTAPYPADATAAAPYIAAYDQMLATAVATYTGQYDWLVVQTHKSQQTNASHWDDTDINAYSLAGFEDLMTKYAVDLALTGHDHSYTRTFPLKSNFTTLGTGGPLVSGGITINVSNGGDYLINPNGTVYVALNSSTGSKYYGIHSPQKDTSKIEYQDENPEYTIIDVTATTLTVTTYIVGSQTVVDSFTLRHIGYYGEQQFLLQ